MFVSNQKCMIQSTFINYYLYAVDLDRCAGSCNTLDDLSSRVCIPDETEDLNLHVFNMITGINE